MIPQQLPIIAERIPQELRQNDQWVVWKYVPDRNRPSKYKKLLIDPRTDQAAASDNPATWVSFDVAYGRYKRGGMAGVGYVFSETDPYVGFDFDHCIDETNTIATWADELLQLFATYAEVSPSGTGIKGIMRGALPGSVKLPIKIQDGRITPSRHKDDPETIGGIELYKKGRFFTITSRVLEDYGTTIEYVNGPLEDLYYQLKPKQVEQPKPKRQYMPKNDHVRRWAEEKMQQIEGMMRDEPDGNLHNRRLELGKLAGGLVGLDLIDAQEAEDRLYNARIPSSHHAQERRAIRDGIEIGEQSPLTMPTFPTDQPIILIGGVGRCPSCNTRVQRSQYEYPGTSEKGWYCPQCKFPMVWPLGAYTPEEGQSTPQYTNIPQELGDCGNCGDDLKDNFEYFQRFEEHNLPPFPVNSLPDWIRSFVQAEAEFTQTPTDLSAMVILAVLATVLQRRVKVQVKQGYTEPLSLFTVVALPPGSRKSAVFAACTAPLYEWEARVHMQIAQDIARAKTERSILEGQQKRAEADAVKKTGPAQQQARQDALRLAQELETFEMPHVPRLIADDITAEGLGRLICEQGGRMAVLSAEGGIFDTMGGRYSSSGKGNFDVYLKSHAGDPLRVDRSKKDHEAQIVNNPALSMGLTMQPSVVRGLLDQGEFKGRGLLGRFLYAIPKNLLGSRKVDTVPVDERIINQYHTGMMILIDLQLDITLSSSIKESLLKDPSYILSFSPAAYQRWVQFSEWLEPSLGEYASYGSMSDWAGKLSGAIVRIAGLLHMAEQFMTYKEPISVETLERAIAIGEYLLVHAKAAYIEMAADPRIADARYIWGWIEKYISEPTVTKRDIYQGVKGRFKTVDLLNDPLALLAERGYIKLLPMEDHDGPGRKPSPRYAINPETKNTLSDRPHNPHNPRNDTKSTDFGEYPAATEPTPDYYVNDERMYSVEGY